MQLCQLLLALSLAGSALTSSPHGRPLRRRANATDVQEVDSKPILNQFIIEFAAGANFVEAVAEITAKPNTKVLKQFDSAVFRGVSVEATSESPESLQKSAKISNAWQSHLIKRLPTILADGVDPKNYSLHSMTKVDKLHEQGIYGKGVKVAIVDTGVDWTHPALGGGLGPKFKVAGGYDFIGDTNWPEEAAKPDKDPRDPENQGHGTHVAGIVAGKGDWFTGVAPEATILAYKVFGIGEYTDTATLIESFLKAFEDGADVITASIGSTSNWKNNPWALVASRLVDEGVVVTIAAGNDGDLGPFRGSTGASGDGVLAVASVEASELLSIPISAKLVTAGVTETHELAFLAPTYFDFFWPFTNIPVWSPSNSTSVLDDACNPLPKKTPSMKGKIVLLRQSLLCDEAQQSANLVTLKPAGIVWYRNLESEVIEPLAYDGFPAGIIPAKAGALLIDSLSKGGKVNLNFAQVDKFVNFPESSKWGGKGSWFSSWGGLWDLTLKPDIAAPGGAVTSLYPLNSDHNPYFPGYRTMSGTSMATPYIAGIAALYISKWGGRAKHGKGFAKMLHSRIVASGESLAWPEVSNYGGSHRASPSQIGNGLVDAVKVLNYTTQLSLTKFSLNDTANFVPNQKVDITNTGTKDVTYTWDVQAAGGYDALDWDETYIEMMNYYEIHMYALKPAVAFPAGTFTVKPGQTRSAAFVFSLPKFPAGHLSVEIPVYSGKILISGSNGERLSVPYYGILSDVKKEIGAIGVFWRDEGFPHIDSCPLCPEFTPPSVKPYWTFETNVKIQDYPSLWVNLLWGSQELRWDIFEANWAEKSWTWPLVAKKNGYVGTATYWRNPNSMSTFDSTKDNATDVIAFPDTFLNRADTELYMWLGQLSNGSTITPGNYTMRVAVLHPFGNRAVSSDWQVMKNPQIQIRPKKKL